MPVQELIETNSSSFKLEDEVGKLHAYAIEHFQKNLPVINEEVYLGCISVEDLAGISFNDSLNNHAYLIRKFFITEEISDLLLLNEFAVNQTDILPVLNENEEWIGIIHLDDFLNRFSDLPFLNFRGEEISLRKKRIDFSYSEIAQIVESQNAKILGVYTSKLDEQFIELSLRIDHNGMNEVLQALRRYDYEILSFHQNDLHSENLRENSAYLDKYLNI